MRTPQLNKRKSLLQRDPSSVNEEAKNLHLERANQDDGLKDSLQEVETVLQEATGLSTGSSVFLTETSCRSLWAG